MSASAIQGSYNYSLIPVHYLTILITAVEYS